LPSCSLGEDSREVKVLDYIVVLHTKMYFYVFCTLDNPESQGFAEIVNGLLSLEANETIVNREGREE